MSSEQLSTLRVERRLALDGGLNTRAGVFMDPSQARALQNLRFSREGELQKRRGGSRLVAQDYSFAGVSSALAELYTPSLTASASGGSLATGTYLVQYTIGTIHGGTIGVSAAAAVAVTGPNGSILIKIRPLNLGDGAGQVAGSADDPINGGFVNNATLRVYARKDADAITQQALLTFSWNSATAQYEATMTSYTTNGSSAPTSSAAIPYRHLVWHDELESTIAWVGDQVWGFSGAHSSRTVAGVARDRSSAAYTFSRLPTRIYTTIIDGVMVAFDGVGKPKKLSTAGSSVPSAWDFRMCGARAPGSAPTAVAGAAGALTGTYQYLVTFVHTAIRPDGTTAVTESNSGPSVSVTPAAQQVDLSLIPVPAETGASGAATSVVSAKRIYRTVAGGSTFFRRAEIAVTDTTFNDNATDAQLAALANGTTTPPDGPNKIPNTEPPAALYYGVEHVQRLFAVQMKLKADSSGRVLRLQGTNEVRYTKTSSIAGAATEARSFDCWPATFSVKCGENAPITALRSFNGVLYAFKEKEIGVILGTGLQSDADFSYRTIWRGAGAMEHSVVEVDNYLYFFDQALGPCRISGYTVEPIAEDAIQTQWFDPITLDAGGEAATGGGRGSAAVLNVIFDPSNGEIRWVMSDYATDYTIGAATSYVMKAYEYVLCLRGREKPRFTVFTGAVSGSTKDRRIMATSRSIIAANPVYRAYDVIYGDYHGRLVKDDQVEHDLDPSPANITISGEFPIFFGDNPEAVKAFRHVYVLLKTGTTVGDAITFKTSSLVKQTGAGVPKTLKTVNGGSSEFRMVRCDVPEKPDTVNTSVQGLVVTITGAAQSGPLRICEMSARMTSGADGRNAP